eukprot:SAG11_NODE_4823_length_1753_cov_4.744256_1_plen_44_part_00
MLVTLCRDKTPRQVKIRGVLRSIRGYIHREGRLEQTPVGLQGP